MANTKIIKLYISNANMRFLIAMYTYVKSKICYEEIKYNFWNNKETIIAELIFIQQLFRFSTVYYNTKIITRSRRNILESLIYNIYF